MFEGKFDNKFGHGQVFCSCGKLLSICKCHTNYHIILKACEICTKPESVKKKVKSKNKSKGKGVK
jgi:hypothetical protein